VQALTSPKLIGYARVSYVPAARKALEREGLTLTPASPG
jgi:hypothetical protein